jgi:glycerol-3-phosphate O-acyltransferase / dihydroxyacetone phosphate acyltransferase
MNVVRAAIRIVFRRAMSVYFRDIEVIGQVPARATGGRIFCGNHVNGLVDPTLVLVMAPCDISPIGKSTLWKIPGLRWLLEAVDAVPIVRRRDDPTKTAAQNDEVFDKVKEHLAKGGNILIFPEGTSHNEPHLLGLRSGAGRMLARAQPAKAGLTFQAVALEFDARTTFRSRALLVFGPAREVDGLGKTGDELAAAITEQVRQDLSELLVEGATWDERLLIARVAEMFVTDADAGAGGERTLAQWNEIGRRVEEAKKALSPGDAGYQKLAREVSAYYAELERTGIADDQLVHGGFTLHPARVARALALVVTSPLALLGVVLYFVPYQLPRLALKLSRGTEDVVSTYKLGAGLVVHPLFAALYAALAFAYLPTGLAALATVLVVLAPFAALAWTDRSSRLFGSIRLLVPSARIDALRRMRADAKKTLDDARARIGA